MSKVLRGFLSSVVFVWLGLLAISAQANDKKILEVSGAIQGGHVVLSFDDLSKFKTTTVFTKTPWTPKTRFEGVALRTLLDELKADAGATTITVTALDGYVAKIPVSEARNVDVILAYKANGKRMTVSAKGPLWVLYPLDDHPEIDNSLTLGRMAWAAIKLNIQ